MGGLLALRGGGGYIWILFAVSVLVSIVSVFFVSTRSWLDISHSLALCVPFQRDGHGGDGVRVSG